MTHENVTIITTFEKETGRIKAFIGKDEVLNREFVLDDSLWDSFQEELIDDIESLIIERLEEPK